MIARADTIFAALLLALALSASSGCASRRSSQATPSAPVLVTLRVRNNLSTPLNLNATQGAAELWRGSVAANATHEATVGPVTLGTIISLRALTATGTVVSSRDSITVRESILIWTIP